MRIFVQFARLAALQVRIEGEAARIYILHKNGPDGHPAGAVGGCQRHRIGQRQLRLQARFEPGVELAIRIVVDILLVKAGEHVFVAQQFEILFQIHGSCPAWFVDGCLLMVLLSLLRVRVGRQIHRRRGPTQPPRKRAPFRPAH